MCGWPSLSASSSHTRLDGLLIGFLPRLMCSPLVVEFVLLIYRMIHEDLVQFTSLVRVSQFFRSIVVSVSPLEVLESIVVQCDNFSGTGYIVFT